MSIVFHCLPFEQLSPNQLYNIMALRQAVFVVEQNCPYLDADGKDVKCYHLWAESDMQTLAYARIVKPGISYPEVSIGRVATALTVRRTGLGKELMKTAIACVYDVYGTVPIRISAQSYLIRFYESFGFAVAGETYLEDGIPHVEMLKP